MLSDKVNTAANTPNNNGSGTTGASTHSANNANTANGGGATGARSQLAPSTPEYAHLEYALQLTLRASTARIVAAYAISNPHQSVQFERRSKDTLVLQAWMDASWFGGINTEEDVVRRGVRFPPPATGLRVTVGRVEGSDIETANGNGVVIHKAVACLVTVGRAYIADEGTAEREPVPEGYDSFYLQDPCAMAESGNTASVHEHTYYIKNPAQVLPQYIVHYEYDMAKERHSRERARCDNCEEELAMVYCAADAANLCNKCDHALHQTKLASRHTRTPIGKGSDVFGNCRNHPDKAIEFFCSQCHVPVCVYCKMVGHHANGEAARHQLVSVSEAYQSALQEAQMPDPILQSRKTEIANQITAVNSRARAVERMGSQIEQQIEEMYQRAMRELKSIIQSKLTILLGDEVELKRQLTDIQRLEEFLKYQQTGDATTYLFNWSRHQAARSAMHDFRYFRADIDVQLDAKITGSISVVVDDDRGHGSQAYTVQPQPLAVTSPPVSAMDALSVSKAHSIKGLSGMAGGGNGGGGGGGVHGVYHGQPVGAAGYAMASSLSVGPRGLGMGLPGQHKMANGGVGGGAMHAHPRRVQRRTSEFFAEALGSFDGQASMVGHHDTDLDY
ncbi:hypothetical protein BC831DRAFT_467143 [Entophlyctis helioformis]|nr:hypothetical protein BC831DRAFT_467143 [Entophlyctis helioformis]